MKLMCVHLERPAGADIFEGSTEGLSWLTFRSQ